MSATWTLNIRDRLAQDSPPRAFHKKKVEAPAGTEVAEIRRAYGAPSRDAASHVFDLDEGTQTRTLGSQTERRDRLEPSDA